MASTTENNANPDVSIGLSFPLGFVGSRFFNRTKTIEEQARHNLKSLLLTNIGERPMQPNFGVGLKKLLFDNIVNADEIKPEIEFQLQTYVPDIQIIDLASKFHEDEQILQIILSYIILGTSEEDSIRINVGSPGETNTGNIK